MVAVVKAKTKSYAGERDQLIGSRIKLFRTQKGLTQTQLATSINITFQQIQKYEKGINRVSASTLFEIAETLNIPLIAFYIERGTIVAGTDWNNICKMLEILDALPSEKARTLFVKKVATLSQNL